MSVPDTSVPDFSMKGRVALITGAGRGIGLGIVQALAAAGAAMAIQDIDRDVAGAEAEKVRAKGVGAIALGGDVSDPAVAASWIDQTIAQLGGLHVLVNNAAVQAQKPWLEVTLEEMQNQFRANVFSPIAMCQKAVPIFRAQKFGRIINIGSIQQRRGNPGMLPYSLSKSAIATLTTALARDVVRDGITVNMIAPGFFNTWRNRDIFNSPERLERSTNWVPMGRVGEPRDCAGAALLLCSDAGSYITGQILYIDGGMSA